MLTSALKKGGDRERRELHTNYARHPAACVRARSSRVKTTTSTWVQDGEPILHTLAAGTRQRAGDSNGNRLRLLATYTERGYFGTLPTARAKDNCKFCIIMAHYFIRGEDVAFVRPLQLQGKLFAEDNTVLTWEPALPHVRVRLSSVWKARMRESGRIADCFT